MIIFCKVKMYDMHEETSGILFVDMFNKLWKRYISDNSYKHRGTLDLQYQNVPNDTCIHSLLLNNIYWVFFFPCQLLEI